MELLLIQSQFSPPAESNEGPTPHLYLIKESGCVREIEGVSFAVGDLVSEFSNNSGLDPRR